MPAFRFILLLLFLTTASAQPAPTYDSGLFQRRLDTTQLAFLRRVAGTTSGELYAYKPFKKLLKVFVPDCMFHYGMDKPLDAALDQLFQGSPYPVQIADNRYLTVYGKDGPYLYGRAFLWVDLQEGIALGAFYFRPTNGEPTPALNVFSREVKDEQLLSPTQLPPAFITALASWSQSTSLPPLMSRYFLTGSNKKILLEHDENLCANPDGSDPLTPEDCGLFTANAADIDLTAADYLDATHHATNATAWMASGEDQAWLQTRSSTCATLGDPLACRIRLTRARIVVVTHRPIHR